MTESRAPAFRFAKQIRRFKINFILHNQIHGSQSQIESLPNLIILFGQNHIKMFPGLKERVSRSSEHLASTTKDAHFLANFQEFESLKS